jgi:TRAP-type C4-dicarboxylate transport system permease small subunit
MNVLTDILPPQVRKYVYAIVALAALVWGAYEASGGDWKRFVGGLIVSLTSATAASNTVSKGGYWGGVKADPADTKED